MRLTSTDTLSVVALAEETVDTTDWECETSLGRTPVMMSVCARWKSRWKTRCFGSKKRVKGDGRGRCISKRCYKQVDLRLSAGLGTAGLASGLAASHFDGFG